MGKNQPNIAQTAAPVAQTASSAVSQTAGLRGAPPIPTRVIHQLRATGVRDFPNPKRSGIHTRGYLPHVKREGASYFVTFRLADSLPKETLLRFKHEWATELTLRPAQPTEAAKNLQRKIERCLDTGAGNCFLADPRIATITRDAFQYFAGKRYDLEEWVIMPNHVHLIIRPLAAESLSSTLQNRKGFIAKQANQILQRTGQPFWQPESYDHWIRNDHEMAQIRRYIRNNPVKARLCKSPEEWRWSGAYKQTHLGI